MSGTSKLSDCKHFEDINLGKFEEKNIFLAVFDGHCGKEAAMYPHNNLWDNIKSIKEFYSDKPEEIMGTIKNRFKRTQEEMLGKSPFFIVRTPHCVSPKKVEALLEILKYFRLACPYNTLYLD